MVECESNTRPISFMATAVLIDTWWNVNNGGFGTSHTSDSVLIDTWWNVNYYGRISITSAYRF